MANPIKQTELKICSFNMHGFNNGVSMTNLLCNNHDLIFLQEHWLIADDLSKLNSINSNFCSFGLSSMNHKIASDILVGRPFGGVAVLWKKSLSCRIKILDCDYANGRYFSVSISENSADYIFTCVYFPCSSNRTKNEYVVIASEIIAHIDMILSNYPLAAHFIIGDFNFECADGNIGYDLFKYLLSDFGLVCCDYMNVNSINYTYCHESLGHFSWLDHIFVSSNIKPYVSQFQIIDSGACLSDHSPVSCTVQTQLSVNKCNFKPKRLFKARWDRADLVAYYFNTFERLKTVIVPNCVLLCPVGCSCAEHCAAIENYYNSIVTTLQLSSHDCVPLIPYNCLKAYWNDDLDKLKSISIDMHNLWRSIGSPRHGVINAARLKSKLDYKQAIKRSAAEFEQTNADELNDHFIHKSTNNFWKCWNSKYKKSLDRPVSVAGKSDPIDIANEFKLHLSNIFVHSSDDINSVNEYSKLCDSHKDAVQSLPIIEVEVIERCINSLKCNKAAGFDGIVSESLLHCHPSIIIHLKLLFTMMMKHSYIPNAFSAGVIIPIIKDKGGDLSSVDNYRPITLSPVISKVFESFLLECYSQYMKSDDLQFGFKNT